MCWASLTVPNAKLMEGKTMAAVASSKSRQPASVVHLAWLSYKKQLVKWPLRTKAITSACIASLSDVIAQRLMGSKYSFVGTVKMAIWGLCIGAPAAHFWHRYLQKWFAGKTDTFETALQKVILDQLTFGPIYNLCFMAYTAMVVNGMPPAAFQTKVVKDYPGLQMNGWKVWSLVGLVNYRFVPLQLRVLFANVVALFW
eukprot:GHRR01019512.1.p1 GENE.GHRR01019512.1~~GHRR01019512.1.p1  ORF type:complete len:199 (+),score=46.06 GHRR01019512.1:792-1388(+)